MIEGCTVVSDSDTQIDKNIFESEESSNKVNWKTLLSRSPLSPNTKHYFENDVDSHSQVTHNTI